MAIPTGGNGGERVDLLRRFVVIIQPRDIALQATVDTDDGRYSIPWGPMKASHPVWEKTKPPRAAHGQAHQQGAHHPLRLA